MALVAGASVRLVGQTTSTGTVSRLSGRRVRLDLSSSGGPPSKWYEMADVELYDTEISAQPAASEHATDRVNGVVAGADVRLPSGEIGKVLKLTRDSTGSRARVKLHNSDSAKWFSIAVLTIVSAEGKLDEEDPSGAQARLRMTPAVHDDVANGGSPATATGWRGREQGGLTSTVDNDSDSGAGWKRLHKDAVAQLRTAAVADRLYKQRLASQDPTPTGATALEASRTEVTQAYESAQAALELALAQCDTPAASEDCIAKLQTLAPKLVLVQERLQKLLLDVLDTYSSVNSNAGSERGGLSRRSGSDASSTGACTINRPLITMHD